MAIEQASNQMSQQKEYRNHWSGDGQIFFCDGNGCGLTERLQLFVLAYNLGNPSGEGRSLQVKLIKMGGRIVHHARRFVFQLAEVAVSRDLFVTIVGRITGLCPSPG